MNKKEIMIQRLLNQSNYQKWYLNTMVSMYVGVVAIFAAILVGVASIVSNSLVRTLFAFGMGGVLIVMNWKFRKELKKTQWIIKDLSKQINILYDELLKD